MSALEKISNQELKGIEAYKFGKALKIINEQIELYNNSRNKLVEQYCVKDENNEIKLNEKGQAQIITDQISIFNQEINKLNNVELELNIPELLIDDLTNFTLTPQEASSLDWWLK